MKTKMFFNGINNGIKISCGLQEGRAIQARQVGRMVSTMTCFVVRWAAIAVIFIGVYELIKPYLN